MASALLPSSVGFWRSSLLSEGLAWLVHGVSGRAGGVSSEPWAALNLGLHVGDDVDAVRENRRRAAGALGLDAGRLVCAEQVHGNDVAVVTASDAGRGALDGGNALPGVDALVTTVANVPLGLFFADCAPVLLADPAGRAVGVAHAGWRGLVRGVLENTVTALTNIGGGNAAEFLAAVGPCIGPCCFEVGPEVAARFDPADVQSTKHHKPRVDLAGATVRRLRAAGLRAQNIDVAAGECTACRPQRWFSHRRDAGRTGRMGAFIGIKETG